MTCRGLAVVVVGGGIGGLATAVVLGRCGATVTVVERDGDRDGHGAGLLMQPNGLAVLRALGLAAAVERTGYRLHATSVIGADGRVVSSLRMPDFGAGLDYVLSIRRQTLLETLRAAANAEPLVEVVRGEAVGVAAEGSVDVDTGARVVLRGDVVVGADGVSSMVRAGGAFGARAVGTGRRYVRGLVALQPTSSIAAHPVGEHWTRLGVFGGAPVGDHLWYFYCSADAPAVASALADGDLPAFTAVWTSVLPTAAGVLAAIPNVDALLVNQAHRVVCDRWVNGCLVLVGDAAHAMEPTLGQGGNSALVDAAVLGVELSRDDDLADALQRYEDRRFQPVRRVQRSADLLARLAAPAPSATRRLTLPARDILMRALGSQSLLARQATAAQQEAPAALLQQLTRALSRGPTVKLTAGLTDFRSAVGHTPPPHSPAS